MIISPTEPKALRDLGRVSMTGEKFGADVFWSARKRRIGIQRKEVGDLVKSIQDGRLGEQLSRMACLDVPMLLIEGRVNWTRDGELLLPWATLTKRQWCGVLWSAELEGVWVEHTSSLRETVERVQWFEAWSRKHHHTSLRRREPVRDLWGSAGNKHFQRHLVSGFPGVGPEIADRIVDLFGGAPLRWSVKRDELAAVKGLGPKKVDRMFAALGDA